MLRCGGNAVHAKTIQARVPAFETQLIKPISPKEHHTRAAGTMQARNRSQGQMNDNKQTIK